MVTEVPPLPTADFSIRRGFQLLDELILCASPTWYVAGYLQLTLLSDVQLLCPGYKELQSCLLTQLNIQ